MLTRVYVDNFRCLVNFEFKPAHVNLIVGTNGSGKSTFLEALTTARSIIGGVSLTTALPPGSLAWWDRRAAQSFELDLRDPTSGEEFQYRLKVHHAADAGPPTISEESVSCEGRPLITFANKRVSIVAEDGTSQSFAFEGAHSPFSAGMGDNVKLARCRALLSGISMFKLNPWSMSARSSVEAVGLSGDGSNFVDWLRGVALEDPEAYTKWQSNLKLALPHIQSLRLQDLGAGGRLLTGMMTRPQNPDQPIPFYDFSEGEKCLAVLHAIAATRTRNAVLSLDEPDNFLSLRELQPVLKEIIEPAKGASPQVFVVSHHPESIDYLAADSTWLFERPTGGHVRVRPMTFDRARGERASESVRAELQ